MNTSEVMSVSCGSMGCTSSSSSRRPKLKAPWVVQNMKYSDNASNYLSPMKRPYQCRRENGEEPREMGEERVQKRRHCAPRELPRENVERELEQPEDGGDNREDAEKEGKEGDERVVVLVVQMLRAQRQIIVIEFLAGVSVFFGRFFGLFFQTSFVAPADVGGLRVLRGNVETEVPPSSGRWTLPA